MSSRALLFASLVVVLVASLGSDGAPLPPPPRAQVKEGPMGMKFVPLPKGTFFMGYDGQKKGVKTEIKNDFEIAVYAVTQEQYQAVMGNNPSSFSRTGHSKTQVKDIPDADLKQFPVEHVLWEEARQFAARLSDLERGKGWTYRLPTEAEWEYACRCGAKTEEECSFLYYVDKPTNQITSHVANINGQDPNLDEALRGPSLGRPVKVGSYKANSIGLYDMHGNICQWCDNRGDRPESLYRGSCWADQTRFCHAAYSAPFNTRGSGVGFRLVRVVSGSK
jgi:formylglycine-generating enzyme required for sulfatase activity